MSRRPPSQRNASYVDQRQSRAIQSMIPGTAGGRLASAAPAMVASQVDAAEGSADSEGTTAVLYAWDEFTLASATPTLSLSYLPTDLSWDVTLNGLRQRQGVNYTLTGDQIAVLSSMGAEAGDLLEVHYTYVGDLDAVPDDDAPSEYAAVQTATGFGNGTTTATFDAPTEAGSLLVAVFGGRWHNTPSVDFPAGWVQESSVIRADADYEVTVWVNRDAAATTSVTVTDDFSNESQLTIAEFSGFGPSPTVVEVGYLVTPFTDGDTLTADTAATELGVALLGWSSRYYDGHDATGFTPADVSEKKAMLLTQPLSIGETVSTDITTGGGANASGGVAISMLYVYDD